MTKRKVDKELRLCIIQLVFLLVFALIFSVIFPKYLPKKSEMTPEEIERMRKDMEEEFYLLYDPLYP